MKIHPVCLPGGLDGIAKTAVTGYTMRLAGVRCGVIGWAPVEACPQRFFRHRCAAWKPHWGQDCL